LGEEIFCLSGKLLWALGSKLGDAVFHFQPFPPSHSHALSNFHGIKSGFQPYARNVTHARKVSRKERNVRKKWPMTWLEFVT